MRATLLVAGLCLSSGCMMLAEVSPSKRLNDAVTEMNKATRWGQLGAAAQMVEPSYRAKFANDHRLWGSRVQLADSEIVHVEMAPDDETALALITYQWYEMSAMTLHETVVRQRWSRTENGYALISEVVIQGDSRIFEPKAGTAGAGSDAPAQPDLMSDPLVGSADG